MSGGSYDYAYGRINDLADDVDRQNRPERTDADLRTAFAAHLRRVADVAHELEWFDSGDRDGSAWVKKARDLLSPIDVLAVAYQLACDARERLDRAIEAAAAAKEKQP